MHVYRSLYLRFLTAVYSVLCDLYVGVWRATALQPFVTDQMITALLKLVQQRQPLSVSQQHICMGVIPSVEYLSACHAVTLGCEEP